MIEAAQVKRGYRLAACLLAVCLVLPRPSPAVTKVKLHGYITSRVDDRTVAILDDKLEMTSASRIMGQDASGEHAMTMAELGPGMLIAAEGQWLDRHRFFAEKITVDLKDAEKQIHATPYLQHNPAHTHKAAALHA